MLKIKKEKARRREEELKKFEMQREQMKKSMFSSAIFTYILAACFFVLSFIYNGRFLEFPDDNTAWKVFAVLFKSLFILLFFFFMFVSMGNFQELRNSILSWKEMLLLTIISILQSSIELYVFLITAVGITLIITYMYFIQGRINKGNRSEKEE